MGKVHYKFDDRIIKMFPGDGVIIPHGVFHEPFVLEPRITLSFAWDKSRLD